MSSPTGIAVKQVSALNNLEPLQRKWVPGLFEPTGSLLTKAVTICRIAQVPPYSIESSAISTSIAFAFVPSVDASEKTHPPPPASRTRE